MLTLVKPDLLPYTVMLLRPNSIVSIDDAAGAEYYIANRVLAVDQKAALRAAQDEVYAADLVEYGKTFMRRQEVSARDYELLVMFAGHIDVLAYGFEIPYTTR